MQKIIFANWKMNGSLDLVTQFQRYFGNKKNVSGRIVLCPPFPLILEAVSRLKDVFAVGAQDCGGALSGAFTGDVSPLLLKELGCSYVLLGHSERRRYACETNESLVAKIKTADEVGLIPIVCVGETIRHKHVEQTFAVLKDQVALLKTANLTQPIHIAYEPVWAIGTGVVPTQGEIVQIHEMIRREFLPHTCVVLYGGSVTPQNAPELLALNSVEGLLVGGASLDPESLAKIAQIC